MIKYIFVPLFIISTNTYAQFGRGSEWHTGNMPENKKLAHSRVFTGVGLSLITTGLVLAKNQQNPQRVDIPIIFIGMCLTIESIRLKKGVTHYNKKR